MGDRIRILYIDDDAGLGRLMQRTFAAKGLEIEHACSGAEGVRRLAAERFDVVALDHDLGSESGLAVLRQIRTDSEAPPVIYVTGSDDVRVAVAALKAGAVDYVWKDVQGHYRDLLEESIAAALAQERLRRAKEQAEREVREAKERAELLLSEVNHRVANSLALVSALARIQSNAVADDGAKLALQEMQARIAAIAGVHRRLYTSSDVRVVEMAPYVASLVDDLSAAMNPEDRRYVVDQDVAPDIRLATDKAVSVGVVITELVTNAYKYAYPEDHLGSIRVALKHVAGAKLSLSVEDDGIGWSGSGAPKGTGIGTRVINAMAANLGSTLIYDPAHRGTRVILEFAN